jgi:hypothetical protein
MPPKNSISHLGGPLMKVHAFGSLPPVSTLTLGGGGLGMLWGPTTFDECVATVHAAVAAGVNLFDLAPRMATAKPRKWSEQPLAAGSRPVYV